jgi:flagellar basal-body rod modification protein FlgD
MSAEAIAQNASAPYDAMAKAAEPPRTDLGKQDFLHLLVTQLANQDPLAPSDPTQFVSQLAQLTSLEQLVNVNAGLDVLAISQTAATSAQMVSFVGKEVLFSSDQVVLDEPGEAGTFHFELEDDAETVTITVEDAKGQVVRTIEAGPLEAGAGSIAFDGNDADGNPLPEGTYTFTVEAKDGKGEPVGVTTRAKALVQSITFENGYPELVMADGRKVTLGQVVEVKVPAPAAAADENP